MTVDVVIRDQDCAVQDRDQELEKILQLLGTVSQYSWPWIASTTKLQNPMNPRLRNDLLCVEWDVKPYTLTQSLGALIVGLGRSYKFVHDQHSEGVERIEGNGDDVSYSPVGQMI